MVSDKIQFKGFAKSALRCIAIALVSPVIFSHRIFSILRCPDLSLESHSQFLSLIPGATGSFLRTAFYRYALEYCDPSATIGFGTLFSKTGAVIGKNAYIGPYCMIGLATISDDALLGPNVHVPSGPITHGFRDLEKPIRLQKGIIERLNIGKNCWIGANTVVLSSVPRDCIVAAGSVVTKSPPERTVIGGVPTRVLKRR